MYSDDKAFSENKDLVREISIANLIEIYKMDILSPDIKSKIISILNAYTKASVTDALGDKNLFPKEDIFVKKLK